MGILKDAVDRAVAAMTRYRQIRGDGPPHAASGPTADAPSLGERLHDAEIARPPELDHDVLVDKYRQRLAAQTEKARKRLIDRWRAERLLHQPSVGEPGVCRVCRQACPCTGQLGAEAGLEAAEDSDGHDEKAAPRQPWPEG
jgi:hypothetical protein